VRKLLRDTDGNEHYFNSSQTLRLYAPTRLSLIRIEWPVWNTTKSFRLMRSKLPDGIRTSVEFKFCLLAGLNKVTKPWQLHNQVVRSFERTCSCEQLVGLSVRFAAFLLVYHLYPHERKRVARLIVYFVPKGCGFKSSPDSSYILSCLLLLLYVKPSVEIALRAERHFREG